MVRRYAHSLDGRDRALIAEKFGLLYEEVDRWPRDRVDYYIARMNAVGQWKQEQSEVSRDGTQNSVQKPADWTQEEWDAVPDSMKADIASGKAHMDRQAVQRHLEAQNE